MRIPSRTLRSRALTRREAGRGYKWLPMTTAVLCLCMVLPLAAASESTPVSAAGESSYSSIPMQSWRLNGVGRSILKVGTTIYVGGSFTEAISPDGTQRVSRRNLAAFDARTGALIPSFRADADNAIYNIQIDANTLYVGGVFTSIGGVSRARLAAIDATTGAVRSGFSADTNGNVYNLSLAGGKLYVGGSFTTIGGQPRTRAAAVSPTSGAVDPNFRPNVDGLVRAIATTPDGATTFIGGSFGTVNGRGDTDVSTLDATTGATVGPDIASVVGDALHLLVSDDGSSLIAGHGTSGNRTAVYDTTSGQRLWRQTVDGDTQGAALVGNQVFAGFHDGSKGEGATRVALYDRSTGAEDAAFRPSFDRFMGAWAVDGDSDALVIAGNFSTISGVRVEGFAIFPRSAPTTFAASVWGYEPWRYLDTGADPGVAWRQNGFNDAAWKSGIGEFGYGDGDERTRISYVGSASNKNVTSWFRREFDATSSPTSAGIYMRVDDGAVVYVNGVEVARDNMPSGAVTPATLAFARDGYGEDDVRYFPVDPTLITPGRNTIGVEVHQTDPASDDLTFFATVVAYGAASPTPPTTTTTTTTTTTRRPRQRFRPPLHQRPPSSRRHRVGSMSHRMPSGPTSTTAAIRQTVGPLWPTTTRHGKRVSESSATATETNARS